MSARNTGTPAADSCSAISCSVLVLPVPVAPATRPCRFSTASGMRTGASGCAVPSMTAAPELQGRRRRRRSPAWIASSWLSAVGCVAHRRDSRRGAPTRRLPRLARVIFKAVGDGRPYPDHGRDRRATGPTCRHAWSGSTSWSRPSATLDLDALLSEDSTFYGDLFAHVVQWEGDALPRGRAAPRPARRAAPAPGAARPGARAQLTGPSTDRPPARHHIVVNRSLALTARGVIIDASEPQQEGTRERDG